MRVQLLQSATKCYRKMSVFGKVLLFLIALLALMTFFRKFAHNSREGMITQGADVFVLKTGAEVYDDFYANIYDYLVYNQVKNDYEVGVIMNNRLPGAAARIADIGCGTGHHVAQLSELKMDVVGIDVSPSMIRKAKEVNSQWEDRFRVGDAMDSFLFAGDSLTHILCFYFTIYYIPDKMRFFDNCFHWLMPGGKLIVHLVEKHKFDPILPPGNPLYIVSPQKYAKERITHTKITFNDFIYNANFKLHEDDENVATFDEKFKFNDGRVRKQEQTLYMEDLTTLTNMAQEVGFILHAKIDMVKCAYENQYLYVFAKPN